MGLSKAETVNAVKEKFGVSKQAVYKQIKIRRTWEDLVDNSELEQTCKSRANYVFRESVFQYLHADNSSAKCGFLGKMLEANSQLMQFLPAEAINTQPINMIVAVENNTAPRSTVEQAAPTAIFAAPTTQPTATEPPRLEQKTEQPQYVVEVS